MIARRATKVMTDVAQIRRWRCNAAPLVLAHVRSLFGLGSRWLVIARLTNGNEFILSRHRERGPATKALERAAKTWRGTL